MSSSAENPGNADGPGDSGNGADPSPASATSDAGGARLGVATREGRGARAASAAQATSGLSATEVIEALGREFFAALDARDPRRLRHTLAANATFRAHPHAAPIRPADEIVAYFGTVVSSYPNAHWDVTDVIAAEDRGAVQFVIREYSARQGRELISEQVAIIRIGQGKIVSMVGYYDTAEFQRVFWEGE